MEIASSVNEHVTHDMSTVKKHAKLAYKSKTKGLPVTLLRMYSTSEQNANRYDIMGWLMTITASFQVVGRLSDMSCFELRLLGRCFQFSLSMHGNWSTSQPKLNHCLLNGCKTGLTSHMYSLEESHDNGLILIIGHHSLAQSGGFYGAKTPILHVPLAYKSWIFKAWNNRYIRNNFSLLASDQTILCFITE